MRLLKGFIFTILGLFTVITLFSLLMPSQVMTTRSVNIVGTDQQKVFKQLADLNEWKNWHPVFKSQNQIVVSSPSSVKGTYAEWNTGDNTNRLELTEISSGLVRFLLKREGEKDVENKIHLTTFENNSIQVEWAVLTRLHWYPWEKFSGIFIEKITGEGYQAALNELKSYVEQH